MVKAGQNKTRLAAIITSLMLQSACSPPPSVAGTPTVPNPPQTPPATPVADQPPVAPEASSPAPEAFSHLGPSELIPGSGPGYSDRTVWAPKLCYPLADEGFANSQVWNAGGTNGPAGGVQCDPKNYSLPWRDNFCETRSNTNALCPGGSGHQGQDIRPKTCKKDNYWAIAAETGTITNIGSYSVTLTGASPPHLQYRYLHVQMNDLAVTEGQTVKIGDHIGKVSNVFGDTPTTIHLHFEIRAGVATTTSTGQSIKTLTFLPPYLSLVDAYNRKLAGTPCT